MIEFVTLSHDTKEGLRWIKQESNWIRFRSQQSLAYLPTK